MNVSSRLLPLLLLLAVALPATLRAGAWSQKEGEGMVIENYTFYTTSHVFDASGTRVAMSNNGTFQKQELNTYAEYGVTSQFTLTGNFFADRYTFGTNNGPTDTNMGFTNQEIGGRYQFSGASGDKDKTTLAQSAQLLFSFPTGYSMTATPVLGNDEYAIEADYFIGSPWKNDGTTGFWEAGAGVRFNIGAPSDQLRWWATGGVDFSKRWKLITQFSGIHGLGDDKRQTVGNNVTLATDYALVKSTISAVFEIDPKWSISFGPTVDLYGVNTGAGYGGQFGVWRRF